MSMDRIKALQRRGCLRPLDVQLAGLADRIVDGAESPLLLAVALASRAVEDGHACIDLADCAGRRWRDLGGAELADEAPLPTWELWREHLQAAAARRVVGGGEDRDPAGARRQPPLSASLLALRAHRGGAHPGAGRAEGGLFAVWPTEGRTCSRGR